MPSSHLILCRPLLLLPSLPPCMRVFSNESTLHMRWPKYWSFSFSISPSKEHPGLISFRMDWLDLLAVQGTLKSLLQHHSSKAPVLRRLAFFPKGPLTTRNKMFFKSFTQTITYLEKKSNVAYTNYWITIWCQYLYTFNVSVSTDQNSILSYIKISSVA